MSILLLLINPVDCYLSVPGKALEHHDSIMSRIKADFPDANLFIALIWPRVVWMVVALNKAAERELKRQFREREPKNLYRPCLGESLKNHKD